MKVSCSCWHGTAQLLHCLQLSFRLFSLTTASLFQYVGKRNCKSDSRIYYRCRFFRTIKQWNLKQYHFRDYVLADRSYCYGSFIHHNRIADSLDWLSGGKNLPEILLGYTQYYGSDNEYSYRNLFWRMDKICHSNKSHCTTTSDACDLCRNPMLCERLAGRTRILLKGNGQVKQEHSISMIQCSCSKLL